MSNHRQEKLPANDQNILVNDLSIETIALVEMSLPLLTNLGIKVHVRSPYLPWTRVKRGHTGKCLESVSDFKDYLENLKRGGLHVSTDGSRRTDMENNDVVKNMCKAFFLNRNLGMTIEQVSEELGMTPLEVAKALKEMDELIVLASHRKDD